MMTEEPSEINALANPDRRRWLGSFGTLAQTIGGLLLFLPVIKFIDFRITPRPRLIKVSKLLRPGGFIIETEFIIFDIPGAPVAVSRKCTHLGCRLNFNEQENLLVCPCHQSRFTRQGKRVSGPARSDLPLYQVAVASDAERNSFVVTVNS
ncbi:MAG: ubiquinol-cytochrome c reductase iron-sulfur subunit [Desulfobulbaceae bacterium]|nr:ubiquinol-cytochrome c reductase iron-sulfur subunit [Desulfobulbaceae bacterium]